jgi:hypothetical protein
MKKYIVYLITILICNGAWAQVAEGFEDLVLDSGKVLNGKLGEKAFKFGQGLNMPVTYDTSFGGFWSSGWAISRKIDSATVKSNFARHLYCAKTAKGYMQSNTFAIGQDGSWFTYKPGGLVLTSLQITNCTYTYNSMKLGDFIGKKFGGKTGKDPDYLLLRIKSWQNKKILDSQDIYLADYRFSDSTKDYLLRDWKQVNFNPWLKPSDSFTFHLHGSDTGMYGLNTPAFFAMDFLYYSIYEGVTNLRNIDITLYPNPVNNELTVTSNKRIELLELRDFSGKMVFHLLPNTVRILLSTAELTNGVYWVSVKTDKGLVNKKIIIQH